MIKTSTYQYEDRANITFFDCDVPDDFKPQIPILKNEVHVWILSPLPKKTPSSLNLCKSLFQYYSQCNKLGNNEFENVIWDKNHWNSTIIKKNANGKPFLVNNFNLKSDIQFNISHTSLNSKNLTPKESPLELNPIHLESIFCIAFSHSLEIGIDIELPNTKRSWKSLAKRFFSPNELSHLEAIPKEEQLDVFYKYWTLKEALIKCLGISLFTALPIAHFEFNDDKILWMPPTTEQNDRLKSESKYIHFIHKKSFKNNLGPYFFSMAVTPLSPSV